MKTKFGTLFSDGELAVLRSKFYYVDQDVHGTKRLFFDNAGGSLRLIKAEEEFHRVDAMPDASEHSNKVALELVELENKARADMRVLFNAKKGAIAVGYTASMLMMDAVEAISAAAKGTNCVTCVLEHPSSFDAMTMYAKKYNRELRVAQANKVTGGIDVDAIISLVDKDTAILSCMSASNISGHVMDIATIAKKARAINPDIFIISDAVQHAPHGALNPEEIGVDAMNFAPYKFFGLRGFALMYLSDRAAALPHHHLLGKGDTDWELGSPCTANYVVISQIMDYVCSIGKAGQPDSADRRTLFEAGMSRIAEHERALLELMLEGTGKQPGLRHINGIRVLMDDPDLNQRDLITGIEFNNMSCSDAVVEMEKRNIVAFERAAASIYSKRMVEQFDSPGVVRLSPLHVNSVADIEEFLSVVQEIASL